MLLSVLVWSACSSSPDGKQAETDVETLQATFVFEPPQAFAECHASSLVRLGNGKFLIAWFGGTKEKDDDVGIWISRGDGKEWTDPVELVKIRNDAHWNPVLFQNPNGETVLFFKVGKEISEWETWMMTSADGGESWSEARELVAGDKGGRGPVRNKPIVLSNGRWLSGASHERNEWLAFVDYSDDQGKNWKSSAYLESDIPREKSKGLIQPTLWESSPGNVHMLLRSTEGKIYRSDSEDYGTTWSAAYATSLPNPNSAIDLTRLQDGTLALLYNPDDENWGDRNALILAFSEDNGQSWTEELYLEKDPNPNAEYSYPAIISWEDSLALCYTWNRDKIAFLKISN